jgi:hypothetical protein
MAHELKDNQQLAKAFPVSLRVGETRRYNTYLTIDWAGGIEFDQVKNYQDEGAQACQRVKLLK